MKSLLGFLPALVLASVSLATAAEKPVWKTGAEFRTGLDSSVGVQWKNNPLRAALRGLSERTRVAIVLDRRVDPDQPVELSIPDAPLETALRQLAARLNLGVSILDSTVYLGPPATTARLATLAAIEQDRIAAGAPADTKKKLSAVAALRVEPLSTPRELLQAWADNAGVKLYHDDRVPHDLWPEIDYPAQAAASRAVLILAGFDLTIEFSKDGAAARVIPLPETATLERLHAGGANPKQRAAQLAKDFPNAKIELAGAQLKISGSFEDHDAIARLIRGEKVRRTEVTLDDKRFTLKVEGQPLAAVAKAIGERVGLEVQFDPLIADKLEQRVSFEVTDVTLAQLMEKLVGPELKCEITKTHLRIGPK